MVNRILFQTVGGPRADARNEAGGLAYKRDEKAALAQLAATGCLNDTFYASAQTQLDHVLGLAQKCDDEFVGKCAVYARTKGYMKDMPALLCAVLFVRQSPHFEAVFDKVIDNGRMLRNFVQIIRSGVTGRKSFGTRGKRKIREWLNAKSPHALFRASVGQTPSLADIIKMVHPKAEGEKNALYAYLIGKRFDPESLPPLVQHFERWKRGVCDERETPNVPFQMLTGMELSPAAWKAIALDMRWQALRMNLNALQRHGVLEDEGVVSTLAARLSDPEAVRSARAFPYQLLMAFTATQGSIPHVLSEALQDAMETAIENVPEIPNQRILIGVDSSGSMGQAVTGNRRGSTTSVSCSMVAGLISAALVRKNPGRCGLVAFDTQPHIPTVNARDSTMTIAKQLARHGGGTNCSIPLAVLNQTGEACDLVVMVSDYESWCGYGGFGRRGPDTGMMREWAKFKRRCPEARMALIDIQPSTTSQAKPQKDILMVGGFSDTVFSVLNDFATRPAGEPGDVWVRQIEALAL